MTNRRDSPTYKSWQHMKQRCYNPRKETYHLYGGRGVTVCDRWLTSFDNFLCDMGPRPDGYTLDRIDSDGDYEPSNCRWADIYTQNRNRVYRNSSTCLRGHDVTLLGRYPDRMCVACARESKRRRRELAKTAASTGTGAGRSDSKKETLR